MPPRSFSSSFPACPTNGSPCLSSWKPGASPTNIRSASESPTPKTTCVRPWARRQRVQPATWRANASSSVSACSVAAATRTTATAAAPGGPEGGLLGGAAVHREDGELPPHVRGAAVRAVRLLAVADELLEVRLALHADVFVERHRV